MSYETVITNQFEDAGPGRDFEYSVIDYGNQLGQAGPFRPRAAGVDLTGVPSLPDDIVDRLRQSDWPTPEQEKRAERAIKAACLEIRKRSGLSLEELR